MEMLDIKTIILCALPLEAEPIVRVLQLKEIKSPIKMALNTRLFVGDHNVAILTMGYCDFHGVARIGITSAALVAWEAIRIFMPKLIINAGTAGGFMERGTCIGDVFLSKDKIYYHGRHMSGSMYDNYALGMYPCTNFEVYAQAIGAKAGTVTTSDSVKASKEDSVNLKRLGADAKDMEAAAIAEVCYLNTVPFVAIKSITDFVDSAVDTMMQFRHNQEIATSALASSVARLIDVLHPHG